MAEFKRKYQCLVCNKVFDSEEEARKCHDGPIQVFTQGHEDYKKNFLGAH
jgi:rubredoxin